MKTYKEYLMSSRDIFYHGSTQELDIGDYILPPSETDTISEKGRKKNLNKIFFTKDYKSAWIYAYRAQRSIGGNPVVYEIEPIGEIDIINSNPGTTVYSADYGIVQDVYLQR